MPPLVALWSALWAHLRCETAHVPGELLERCGDAARPTVSPPRGEWGGGGQCGREPVSRPPRLPAGLPWQFTPGPCALTLCSLSLSLPGCVSSFLSLLSLPVPPPAPSGLIAMALTSVGSKCWNKHVRLDIGLCRQRRSVARLLPAPWLDSRWTKWRAWAPQRTPGEHEESAGASDAKVLLFWRFPAFSTSSLSCPSKREFSKLCIVREITVSLVSVKAYTRAKAR